MTKENKNVAETQAKQVVETAPSKRGFEEPAAKSDLLIPRAKLLQSTSPEIQDETKSFEGKDLKMGMIVNSLTKEILGETFIPIFMFKNWIRFNPRSQDHEYYDPNYDPGQEIWRSNDPLDPLVLEEGAFGSNGEKPKATCFMNFFSVFEGSKTPVIISFSNTSYKAGKQLYSMARFSEKDMFAMKYALRSSKKSNDKGTFHVLGVFPSGMSDPEQFKACETLWDEFHQKKGDIKVHDEEGAETEKSSDTPY